MSAINKSYPRVLFPCINMKKQKIIETPLPEEVIQHIQSFMSGKEAARTTILSKSWHNAWLTRPTIDIDYQDFDFDDQEIQKFLKRTMERYQGSNLNIQTLKLRCHGDVYTHHIKDQATIYPSWIITAMKMRPKEVDLDLNLDLPCTFELPRPVLGSETLFRLTLTGFMLDGIHVTGLSSLKSLVLNNVGIPCHLLLEGLISRCVSLEELSIRSVCLARVNACKLQELRRLVLHEVILDSEFFTGFASRFPCLKDLTISKCIGCPKIQIAASSLQIMTFVPENAAQKGIFHLPNIRKFTYSNSGLPTSLSIGGATREWELNISIVTNTFGKPSWFLNLKRSLAKFSLSRISLRVECKKREELCGAELDVELEVEQVAVERLVVDAPPKFRVPLLLRLLRICRPKLVALLWISDKSEACFDAIYERLVPNMYGAKRVNVEIYKKLEDALLNPTVRPTYSTLSKRSDFPCVVSRTLILSLHVFSFGL